MQWSSGRRNFRHVDHFPRYIPVFAADLVSSYIIRDVAFLARYTQSTRPVSMWTFGATVGDTRRITHVALTILLSPIFRILTGPHLVYIAYDGSCYLPNYKASSIVEC
jgi:hypothetical protein